MRFLKAPLAKNFILQVFYLDICRVLRFNLMSLDKVFSALADTIAHVKILCPVKKRFAEFFVDFLSWVLILLVDLRNLATTSYLIDVKLFQGELEYRLAQRLQNRLWSYTWTTFFIWGVLIAINWLMSKKSFGFFFVSIFLERLLVNNLDLAVRFRPTFYILTWRWTDRWNDLLFTLIQKLVLSLISGNL